MATKIETFDTREVNSKYPWAEWTDGSIWELHQGTDYHSDAAIWRANLYAHACKRCLTVKSMIFDDGKRIQFRFEPKRASAKKIRK